MMVDFSAIQHSNLPFSAVTDTGSSTMFTPLLKKIVARQDLTENEAAEVMDQLLEGKLSEAQIAAFMVGMASKGETSQEVAGAARAMRRRAIRVQVVGGKAVDTVGTGGDGTGTFNISTTCSFVVAGAGVRVAKHGNRGVSSSCGSADVLEALGLNLQASPDHVEEAINEIGIGFLFAPLYHSAMKHAAPVRKALGIRSIFNMLGPLTNPAGATCQLIGVYAPQLTETFAETLRILGSRHAFVVHGHDHMDEITTTTHTRISELKDGQVRTSDFDPAPIFGGYAKPSELAGGVASVNAEILRGILSGKDRGPRRNIVLINAAYSLLAADRTDSLETALAMAGDAIDSGAAEKKLDALIARMRNAT